MPTPNSGIPYVPENTTDPAAGLNLSLNVIDALLTPEVLGLGTTSPPGSPSDGDLYVVGAGATGAWAGEDDNLARYVAEGAFWQFYEAGIQAKAVLYLGAWYTFFGSAGWVGAGVPSVSAGEVGYNNATSGLAATDVQAAIDELAAAPPGAGDVVGPASATADALPQFDGTTGKLLKNGPTIATIKQVDQNSQSSAYTLMLADAGKHILHPSADTTARTFTIPANSSVAFPVGTAVTFVNQNAAGAVTIAITTDTMRLAGAGTTGSRTLAANGIATALKITSTEWIINGTGLT